jgi:hypothetical protein
MKILLVVFTLLILESCDEYFNERDLYGYYVPIGYVNTFDTIQLKPNSLYHRVVYDKNSKLLLKMEGQWIFKGGNRIVLNSLYLNLDDNLVEFPESANDTTTEMDAYFKTKGGHIQFCVGQYVDSNCYQKLE